MGLPRIARQTVTLVEPVMVVERDELVPDWSEPVRIEVSGCSVQPGNGGADYEHADGLTADYTVYMPPGTALPDRFRVELPAAAGQFVLQGEPQPWLVGMRLDHIRIRLERRDG